MCLKCTKEITNPLASVNLIDDDSRITFELFLFSINIKKEICGVLEFLSFSRKYEKKKNPTTCYLILKPKFHYTKA